MSVKSPAHITVTLPEGVAPSYEMNEVLIRKFLKACKKENIQENVFEKSCLVKRFERPAETERQRKMAAKRRALRDYADAQNRDVDSKTPRKKNKNVNNRNNTKSDNAEKKDGQH